MLKQGIDINQTAYILLLLKAKSFFVRSLGIAINIDAREDFIVSMPILSESQAPSYVRKNKDTKILNSN